MGLQQSAKAVQDAQLQERVRTTVLPDSPLEIVIPGYIRVEVLLAEMQNGERATVLRLIQQPIPGPQPTNEEGKEFYEPKDTGGAQFSMAKVMDTSQTPRIIIDPTPSPSTYQVRAVSGAKRTVIKEASE